jgi:hypothetical protein
MPVEFADALSERLSAVLTGVEVAERAAVYAQGGPVAGQVTWSVDYPDSGAPLARIISVTVDADVWAKGPTTTAAETIAAQVEAALIGWTTTTERQGTVRLGRFSRATMAHDDDKLAHVTMRFTGRAFRRL